MTALSVLGGVSLVLFLIAAVAAVLGIVGALDVAREARAHRRRHDLADRAVVGPTGRCGWCGSVADVRHGEPWAAHVVEINSLVEPGRAGTVATGTTAPSRATRAVAFPLVSASGCSHASRAMHPRARGVGTARALAHDDVDTQVRTRRRP